MNNDFSLLMEMTRNWQTENQKIDFDALVSTTWVPSPTQRSVVTLTFDLKNLIRLSVENILNAGIPCKLHRDCSSRSWDISW